jgi:hypothetical protein
MFHFRKIAKIVLQSFGAVPLEAEEDANADFTSGRP